MPLPRSLTLLFCLVVTGPVKADGLLYRLPKDGTTATYAFKETTFPINGKEEKLKSRGFFTIASVGREKVDGEDCRWLEIVIEAKTEGRTVHSVFKALVPEQHLGKGKNPLNHWIRGWAKLDKEKSIPLTKEMLRTPAAVKMNLYITGPLERAKPLKEKVISTKAFGDMKCRGVAGYHTLKDGVVIVKNGVVTKRDAKIRFKNYLHDKAPFGVVWSEFQMDGGEDQAKTEAVLVLTRVEAGAKSQLPDHK
jgi:hypothetical protein